MSRTRGATLKLTDCWLYAVSSKADLARRLSTDQSPMSAQELEVLAVDRGNFKLFQIKANGRAVQEPKHILQKIHKRIHKLLSRVITPGYLHSARKGKSYLTNARSHRASVATVKIDVKRFFRSVPRRSVYEFFLNTMKCRKDVAGLLADILTYNGHLPTGSSASPIISYYAFKPMFDELYTMAKSHNLAMTCYIDDLTFSGAHANSGFVFAAHKIIARYGLRSHKMKVFGPNQPKIITGVCNTPSGERVPNKLHLKISEGFNEMNAASSGEAQLKLLRRLLGRMEAARQIAPVFGARAQTLRAKMKKVLNPSAL
jgi:RNA-directed DNA polymerase